MNSKEALFELYKQVKSHTRTTKQIIDNKQQYEQIGKDLNLFEEYKKIEEELGIDLITLFKALKDGINVYYEDEERYKFHNDLRIEYHKTLGWGLVYIYGSCCRNDMPMMLDMEFYELKGYGKTWALTKEELENGK